ncbi:E3 ubiquitin-protein ligase TRIM71-like [Magallana gigas]|uniref:E3 ubiquitin-protein ligase TRIM71-like n=1 Tax=Magallana gigas TaxID=29159 RepID=UPI0033401EC3
MDPHFSAQDLHRCDLCETAIVHSYCDFCHVNLCKPCILDHILDEYDKHKIVPFKQRRSTLIYPKCDAHQQETCKYQCRDCKNIYVCSSCIASEQHRGHIFEEITNIYKIKKESIEKDREKLENLITPLYKEIALDLENQLANLDGGYEKLTKEMSRLKDEWHREIDIVINKMKTEIDEIKMKHEDILKKHLDKVLQTQSFIKQTLVALREMEKSTEISPTIEYCSNVEMLSKHLDKICITMPTFIPKPIDRTKLFSMFGVITPLSTTKEENVLSLNQSIASVRELLDEPELVATIQTGHGYLRSVTCLNEDSIWTSGETSDIKCFMVEGSLLQTIKTRSEEWPRDIAVDSDGDLLYCDWENRTVCRVKNGQTEKLIILQGWRPSKFCVSYSGDILVSMTSVNEAQSKVIRYSGAKEKQIIQYDDKGKHLYSGNSYPRYITENRNHDICVADCGARAIVVVNQVGKLQFRYAGHPSVTKKYRFLPYGITTDSQSRILTADFDNHCIHILDKKGQFLRYFDNCDLNYPFGLCVDKNDNLFVCEHFKGNVKKIKYSK